MNDKIAYEVLPHDRGRGRYSARLIVCNRCEHHQHGGPAPVVTAGVTVSGRCGCVCHLFAEFEPKPTE